MSASGIPPPSGGGGCQDASIKTLTYDEAEELIRDLTEETGGDELEAEPEEVQP